MDKQQYRATLRPGPSCTARICALGALALDVPPLGTPAAPPAAKSRLTSGGGAAALPGHGPQSHDDVPTTGASALAQRYTRSNELVGVIEHAPMEVGS